ncbi:MAG: glycoside hydrolase family 88 protein [Clostridia bacterium]|nr:glycoside hydrolase family 88 protein [Clostridia bacterium]
MQTQKERTEQKLQLLIRKFRDVLYEDDEKFLEGMKNTSVPAKEILKYRHWEWTQGVGLYGFWKYYQATGDGAVLGELTDFYEARLAEGLPGKNVNTTAPMLTLSYLYELTKDERYGAICREWADWLMNELPKTRGGGFQHLTSDTLNDQELWDDTLFMAVLFLANMGRIEHRADWIAEAKYQFLLHIRYLADPATGLFFHGWTFNGRHNFARGRWGRGNSWLTAAIPELLTMIDCEPYLVRYLGEVLTAQADALEAFQSPEGMWHTLVDDPSSYLEASCTCGFGYGLLAGVRMELLDARYKAVALKALDPILDCIDETGTVQQVSYGTPMGRDSVDFYKQIELKPMPYGTAMAILFLLEALPLLAENGAPV